MDICDNTPYNNGTKARTKITCHQFPIEPAFSLNSNGCQGQTISKILADLWIGGFSTYVQASRVTNREGICLTESITLRDLQKSLPINLKKENMRLHAFERNTLINYGFEEGDYVDIPDIESEQGIKIKKLNPNNEILPHLNEQKDGKKNQDNHTQNKNEDSVRKTCLKSHELEPPKLETINFRKQENKRKLKEDRNSDDDDLPFKKSWLSFHNLLEKLYIKGCCWDSSN